MTNQENQDNSTASSDAEMLDLLDVKDIHDGMWMKVKYNREIFLGKVLSVVNNETQVDALDTHLGYCNHRNLNRKKMQSFMRQCVPLTSILR